MHSLACTSFYFSLINSNNHPKCLSSYIPNQPIFSIVGSYLHYWLNKFQSILSTISWHLCQLIIDTPRLIFDLKEAPHRPNQITPNEFCRVERDTSSPQVGFILVNDVSCSSLQIEWQSRLSPMYWVFLPTPFNLGWCFFLTTQLKFINFQASPYILTQIFYYTSPIVLSLYPYFLNNKLYLNSRKSNKQMGKRGHAYILCTIPPIAKVEK